MNRIIINGEDKTSEAHRISSTKYKCKICGELIIGRDVLDHAVIKHDDKDAADLLNILSKLGSGR